MAHLARLGCTMDSWSMGPISRKRGGPHLSPAPLPRCSSSHQPANLGSPSGDHPSSLLHSPYHPSIPPLRQLLEGLRSPPATAMALLRPLLSLALSAALLLPALPGVEAGVQEQWWNITYVENQAPDGLVPRRVIGVNNTWPCVSPPFLPPLVPNTLAPRLPASPPQLLAVYHDIEQRAKTN